MRARLVLSLTLLALAVAAPAAHAATIGISDQDPSAFADARLRGLGLTRARLVVPYDAATSEPARVQAWLDAAAAAGLAPHVAFEHARGTRCPASPCSAPTRTAYAQAVRRFVARFPQVRTYTTWNEANHVSQPVADGPSSWPATTRSCAPDAVLAAVPGRLWIEETGGIVTLRNAAGVVTLAPDRARAATAIARAFAIASTRPRVTRMYVYQWRAGVQDRSTRAWFARTAPPGRAWRRWRRGCGPPRRLCAGARRGRAAGGSSCARRAARRTGGAAAGPRCRCACVRARAPRGSPGAWRCARTRHGDRAHGHADAPRRVEHAPPRPRGGPAAGRGRGPSGRPGRCRGHRRPRGRPSALSALTAGLAAPGSLPRLMSFPPGGLR